MAGSGVLGIDVALPEEFPRGYPLGRAFGTAEFAKALKLCAGNCALTAALLWSLKEAAVKAVGLGFHCFDPLEVEANFSATQCDGLLFQVRAGRPIGVRAFREGGGWLAVAYSPSSQIAPSHHTGRPIGLDEDNHGLH
jgi:phosphopantetheinyl transferase